MFPVRLQSAAERLRTFRRIAETSATSDEGVSAVMAGSVLLLSCGFFGWVISVASSDPTFFERQLIAGMVRDVDPIVTGSVSADTASVGAAIPVPEVVRADAVEPSDYTIVALFETEAVLAAGDELWRVRVGSTLPALGAVLAIEASGDGGGTVRTEKATLSAGR